MRRDACSFSARIAVADRRAIAAARPCDAQDVGLRCRARGVIGILFVLRTGIPWEMLPAEMRCESGVTGWRRLRDWQAARVWDRLDRELLRRLRDVDGIDWSRACRDSPSIAAKKGCRDRSEPHGSSPAGRNWPRFRRRSRWKPVEGPTVI